ncbi:MAG: molybdopterin-dependent oxidoreductase [Spartobacteria bacterium]
MINIKGRIQRLNQAIQPPGQARDDWEVLRDLVQSRWLCRLFRWSASGESQCGCCQESKAAHSQELSASCVPRSPMRLRVRP